LVLPLVPVMVIEVRDLSFTYPGAHRPALKNISFGINRGEIFGFLGPSGAGKSTTQKVLNGLLRNYRGSVMVNGTELTTAPRSFYEQIGVAFEFPNLYQKLTAVENLRLFASFYKSETRDPDELLEMTGLGGDRDTRVGAFSKGMKMRLNFARALLNRPEILFLDEPTAGLDPGNARKMKDIIMDLRSGGVTIFLTTHNMADAEELCSRIAFMVDGTLPLIDATRNLKLNYGKKIVRVTYLDKGGEETAEFGMETISEPPFRDLVSAHEVLTIHTQEASLEKIFLEVTGKHLIP